jgi:hypothetical protein
VATCCPYGKQPRYLAAILISPFFGHELTHTN